MIKILLIILVIMLVIPVLVCCAPKDETQTSELPADEMQTSDLGLSLSSYQKQDDWIYYVNNETRKLWRVSTNGEEKMQVGDDETGLFVIYEESVL